MWLEINGVSGSISSTKNDPRLVDVYRRAARQIYEMEVEKYMKAKSADTSGDAKWIRTVMKTGTLSDRVAALALQIQESPVHQLSTLSNLLMMANKKVKREALIAVDTLKELFMVNLLPENRKLRSIGERPFDQLSGSDKKQMYRQLLLWHVEDEVKKSYGSMMNALDSLLKDPQFEIRKKVLAIVQQLLAERPEQEQALLKLLSNKLGDPERRLASTASHYLLLLVNRHPNMRLVIVNEIERFMYRPNLADRARYYAVCFLNQQILSRKDKDLANKLISVYFSFYSKCSSGKDSELDSKMLSALLVGVNRAFPFAELKDEELDVHVNTLYSTVHKSTFNASVQALMLLFQIMQSRQSLSDRFYCALYSKLMDHRLVASSKQSVFMNLLYKAIKADPRISRVKAFIKRVLQVCNMMPPSFVCGALFMISQLCTDQPAIRTIIDQPEDTEEEEHFKDVQLDDDEDDENDNSEDADDEQDESAHAAKDSDAEATTEDFGDVDDAVKKLAKAAGSVKPSKGFADRGQQEHYVALHRNPLYCGAEHSCSWEIRQFAVHYHPSVRTFAEQVVAGVTITYKGDPLQDFTLVRFLDRFVFRNPKKRVRDHGGSVMQRKETSHLMTELPVNHTSFWSKNEDKIRPDEVFYHRYFRQLNQLHPHKLKSKPGNDTEDVADEGPEGDEESMDFASDIKTTVKSNKREQSQKGGKRKKERQDSDDDEGAPVSGRGGRHGAADEDSSDDDSDEDLGEGEGSDDDEDIDSGDDFDELLGGNADDEDMGGGDFDEELGEEFNYSDLDDMSDEDMSDGDDADQAQKGSKSGKAPEQQKKKKKKKFTDADYEKALFENLSSDEDGTASSASAAGLSDDMSKMFMGAEEFAAMLKKKKSSKHGSASQLIAKDGVSQKQLDWEEKRINAGQNYRQRKRQFRRGR
ncbi:CCAAT/enhancer-binding protein zeta-like [Sycon ciliatum]|uniref:CCAAT/enhancer-binding protein zeta-like n=1 Tax=Sycon ciliatum TaxID=27933 RepID=UPI0031F6097E